MLRPLPVCLPADAGGGIGETSPADKLRPLPLLQLHQLPREQHQLSSAPYLAQIVII